MREPGFEALEARRGQLDAIRENTSRLAVSQCSFHTHGWGEFKIPAATYFTSTFIDRPFISTGMSIRGDALIPTRYPRVTAGVYRWVQDVKGFYTGAWVFFVIDTLGVTNQSVVDGTSGLTTVVPAFPSVPPLAANDPGYDLIHDFSFIGIAIKALPSHLLEQ